MPAQRATTPQPSPSTGTPLLAVVFLFLLIALAYSNTLRVPLLFDDEPAIAKNESIRSLATAFSPPKSGEPVTGRPLLNATFALNYATTRLSLPAIHLTNILIHILAALALFGVIRRTLVLPGLREKFASSATPLAWFAAALWALHPLQTESVTYLSQRAESLGGLFYLLALYAFIRANNSAAASRRWLWLSWLACLAGVATKEVVATFPLIALLYERVFLRESFRACWQRHGRLYLALAATWLVLGWLIASGGVRGNTVGFAGEVTWWSYLCTQSYAITHYLWLAIWPSSLSFEYGSIIITDWRIITACSALVLTLLGITGATFRKNPRIAFLGAWFFLILAPTSSIVPVITQTVAEHRMYLPLASLTTGAAVLAWHFLPRGRRPALVVLVLAASFCSYARNHTYRSDAVLWEDTVAKRAANARAINNLGLIYVKQKRFHDAIPLLRRALETEPFATETNYNLGLALARVGHDEEALKYYEAALKAKPDNDTALANQGAALLRLGRIEESIARNEAALRINPSLPEPNSNLGLALLKLGQTERGFFHLKNAAALQPNSSIFARQLVTTLIEYGRRDEAIEACEAFLQKNSSADFYTLLGVLHAQNRQLEKARTCFLAALRLDPAHTEATQNLSRANALLAKRPASPTPGGSR